MLVSEFIDRTGYRPTSEEYAEIESAYNHYTGDKDSYCRAWCKANPHKASTLWEAIKEQERLGKVFDNVVTWITKHTKCTRSKGVVEFWREFLPQDWRDHIEEVQRSTKCKDRRELRVMLQKVYRADAVTRGWTRNVGIIFSGCNIGHRSRIRKAI